jgi:hypothetical protein
MMRVKTVESRWRVVVVGSSNCVRSFTAREEKKNGVADEQKRGV